MDKNMVYLVVDVTGDRSKVQCYKEQYCIGTWNIGSGQIGDGKSECRHSRNQLKWTGMGEFNSDDYYIYYCGQESLRRNGVAITVKKDSEMQYLDAISKMTE